MLTGEVFRDACSCRPERLSASSGFSALCGSRESAPLSECSFCEPSLAFLDRERGDARPDVLLKHHGPALAACHAGDRIGYRAFAIGESCRGVANRLIRVMAQQIERKAVDFFLACAFAFYLERWNGFACVPQFQRRGGRAGNASSCHGFFS